MNEYREIAYENGWSDYEEGSGVTIYQVGDKLFCHTEGSSCYGGSWDEEREITWEEAMVIIEEWEEELPTLGD